jgi:imidazolonepropionase-like amidohydrolase
MLDVESIQMFLDTGTYLVPTLFVMEDIRERGEEIGLSPLSLEKFKILTDVHMESFSRAAAAGVKIGAGTDITSSVSHGKNARELTLMVRHGLTPMQAIVAATKTAAEVCRIQDRAGTLEPGKLADLLVLDGDPLADITVLEDQAKLLLVMTDSSVRTAAHWAPT